ncbi:Ribonucleoside-diphosphate reductase subunit M2, partial [Mucuna pruriens]
MGTLQEGRGFNLDDGGGRDLSQWKCLANGERYFITHVLETRALYSFQIAMENFHFEMFSLLLDTYVKDSTQKVHLFRTIDNISSIVIFRKTFVSSFGDKTPFHWERSREVHLGCRTK